MVNEELGRWGIERVRAEERREVVQFRTHEQDVSSYWISMEDRPEL